MKKEVNIIDAAIIDIACKNPDISEIDGVRFWNIPEPEQLILEQLGNSSDIQQIRERIKKLKTGRLILTKSTGNGKKYKRLSINEQFFVRINGYAPAVQASKPEVKVDSPSELPASVPTVPVQPSVLVPRPNIRGKSKLIYVAVDFENILYSERQYETRVSFYRLKEYIRTFGAIRQAQIFFPLHYLDRNKSREVTYLTSTRGGGWQVVICGQSTKDKDQVDFHIAQSVRDQCYHDPDLDIWIISQDSDFVSLVEQSKDRGLNNIKLLDPFTIPFLLGGEPRGTSQKMSRAFSMVSNEIDRIGEIPHDNESAAAKLIRYSAGFVLLNSNSDNYPHLDSLYNDLKLFLEKNCPGEFNSDPGIYKTIIKVFKDKGIVARVGKADDGKIIVNPSHPQLTKLAPPHFVGALSAISGNGHHEVAVA
ncbi:NYN domain-containing protein [bacterium]|nr:MAG: NYN domain-containing protein [bacterium]